MRLLSRWILTRRRGGADEKEGMQSQQAAKQEIRRFEEQMSADMEAAEVRRLCVLSLHLAVLSGHQIERRSVSALPAIRCAADHGP